MAKTKQANGSQIFIQDILISKLKRTRTTRILLPEAYYKFPERRFPVMYMLDGQNLFDPKTAYFRSWNLQKIMDGIPHKNQIILVGIDNGGHYRGSEYLPHHHHKLFHHGEGDIFIDFIINELKPKVDLHLRTLTDRGNTMIAGSSLGGLLSFYAATRYCHIFGKAGVLSPAFWVFPHIYHFTPKHFSKIYVLGSKTESGGMSKTLERTYHALKDAGYPENSFRVTIKDRGRHSEVMWGKEFKRMLTWLMA
ncbi:MAG: alpha/beta hydrolase [Saprospiraceae bacterium]|nr:alpha/beta hydrolase [Saprospiraceae bacterium]